MPLVWLCKGFEEGSGLLPHQIVEEVLGGDARCGALSGPSFAPRWRAACHARSRSRHAIAAFARESAALLHGGRMRVYYSADLVGVEIGGAVKNVMAIAAGISDGLGLGLNARAALITRGLAEIARLGAAFGGRPKRCWASPARAIYPHRHRRPVAQPACRTGTGARAASSPRSSLISGTSPRACARHGGGAHRRRARRRHAADRCRERRARRQAHAGQGCRAAALARSKERALGFHAPDAVVQRQ